MKHYLKRALLSVSDKTGIVELAKELVKIDCEIISTGGTRKKLEEAGIPVTEISSVTGNQEAFGGRMKTISFNIESALLFDREKDKQEAASLNIEAIDLVVCNLYPFQKVLEQNAEFETLIENIDIGGPTMIRSAAKNFKYVTVITKPEDYLAFINNIKENAGSTSIEFRKKMMRTAFNHTADYDALIADTMNKEQGEDSLRLHFSNGSALRYGENSHQSAKLYQQEHSNSGKFDLNILHGKAISFNNVLDINAAIECVTDSKKVACSIIKHCNPCGYCEGANQREVLELAWQSDPISAFGSIIAFNTNLTLETVLFFDLKNEDKSKRKFIEVVIAPSIENDALEYLQSHKNLRIIQSNIENISSFKDIRYLNGQLLVQEKDTELHNKLESLTKNKIDLDKEKDLIKFGLSVIKNIKSNTICIVRKKGENLQLLGMGAGQPNRLIATRLAIEKSKENLKNEYTGNNFDQYLEEQFSETILISDAFFPFPDNVELAHQFGIKKIVQPGGSIKDKKVIEVCDALNIAMLFTGLRHFKH